MEYLRRLLHFSLWVVVESGVEDLLVSRNFWEPQLLPGAYHALRSTRHPSVVSRDTKDPYGEGRVCTVDPEVRV